MTLEAGPTVKASIRLEPGQVLVADIPSREPSLPEAEDIPLEVKYSDDRVLVVSKPPGLVTHPARGHETGTLVNALLGLGGPLSGSGSIRPGIVHRLDKDTSGLLLVAKDDAAKDYLVDALRARKVERRYLALVRGSVRSPSGTVDAPIGRHPFRRRLMAVVSGGRASVTHYRVLGESDGVSLLDVSLETGRTHQIRVHLAHLGHPVIGDRTYGGGGELAQRFGLERPFLHAYHLVFPHPDDDHRIDTSDELPEDLETALRAAGMELETLPEA